MIRLFRSPQPAVLFLTPLIVIALWLSRWSDLPVITGTLTTPLWNLLEPLLQGFPSWLRLLLMVVTVSSSAVYFNLVLNRYEVLYRNSYLPALFYVLVSSCLPDFIAVHPLHFANLLLIRVLDLSYSLNRPDKAAGRIFGAGFLVSLAVMLSFSWILLAVYYLLLLALLRSSGAKEWLIAITGLSLPFFFLAVWWFPEPLFRQWEELRTFLAGYHFTRSSTLPMKPYWLTVYMAVLLALSLLKLRGNYYKNIVRTRMYQQTILLLLFMSLIIAFTSGSATMSGLFTLVLPVSTFFAYYFVTARRRIWMYESLLWGFIGLIVWNHISY